MRSRPSTGFTLIETLIGVSLLAFAVLGVSRLFASHALKTNDDANRIRAQFILESITDLIASSDQANFISLINSECQLPPTSCSSPQPIGSASRYFTSTSAMTPWIQNWESQGVVAQVKIQFRVFDASGARVYNSLAAPITNYSIEIATSGRFQSSGGTQKDLLWTKRIEHQ